MAVYLVSSITVRDEEQRDEYEDRGLALLESFGGRAIVDSGSINFLRGDWKPRRLIIVEFEEMDDLRAMLDSDEFARLRELAAGVIDGDLVFVDGIRPPRAQSRGTLR